MSAVLQDDNKDDVKNDDVDQYSSFYYWKNNDLAQDLPDLSDDDVVANIKTKNKATVIRADDDFDEKNIFGSSNDIDFDSNLLEQLKVLNKDTNLIVSPLSILTAMTLCLCGAKENTLKEMLNTLYPNIKNKHLTWNKIISAVTSDIINKSTFYNNKYDGSNDKLMIKIANKIMMENSFNNLITDKYKKLVNAKVDNIQLFDAQNKTKTANDVNKFLINTDNMIIKPDDISDNATLILLNAIYFDGNFINSFDENQTKENVSFYSNKERNNEILKVSMMYNDESQYFIQKYADIYDIVKLKYKQSSISLILVINNHSIRQKQTLSMNEISKLNFVEKNVNLYVPKFKFEKPIILNGVLKKMGINDAFDKKLANFQSISSGDKTQCLWISKVIHKAVIEVDEKGTKVPVTAAVLMNQIENIVCKKPPTIKFDHPFTFYVYDEQKKITLFCGEYVGK